MPTLYVLRHGQTEFNLQHLVQGHCDSPLTPLGERQARSAARWLADQQITFDRMCSSPLGRAAATLAIVREELERAGVGARSSAVPGTGAGRAALPPAELLDGLIERDFGRFEGGPTSQVPADLWDPGEELVPYGGEGSGALRERIVATMTAIMERPGVETALAVCHGSAMLQFKLAWAQLARCPQDVALGNCCILVFDYDPAARAFANTALVNQDEG